MTKEEHNAYSRGYAAGRRKHQSDAKLAAIKAGERDFWERAVLTVAPYFMGCDNWSSDGRKLTSLNDRTKLCTDFADKVAQTRRLK